MSPRGKLAELAGAIKNVAPAPPERKNGNQRHRGGWPAFQPTADHRKTVEAMISYGIPQDEVAGVIGCSADTLAKYFPDEIAHAQARANAKVAQRLFQKAMDGDTTSCIFWLKCRARWRERTEIEHSGQVALGAEAGVERLQSELARIIARAQADATPVEVDEG